MADHEHFDEEYQVLGLQLLDEVIDKLLFFLILFVTLFILLNVVDVDIDVIVNVILDIDVDMYILTLFSFKVSACQLQNLFHMHQFMRSINLAFVEHLIELVVCREKAAKHPLVSS